MGNWSSIPLENSAAILPHLRGLCPSTTAVSGCGAVPARSSISWNFWLAPQVGRAESSSQREPLGNEVQMLAMKSQVCMHRNVRHKAIWNEASIATALVSLFEMREKVIDIPTMNLLLWFRICNSYSFRQSLNTAWICQCLMTVHLKWMNECTESWSPYVECQDDTLTFVRNLSGTFVIQASRVHIFRAKPTLSQNPSSCKR